MISVFLLSFWFVCCGKGYPLYQQFPSKMLLGMDKSWTIIMTSMSGKLASASWSLLALASIPGAAQGHHVIFHAKGPPCPLPHIYHCYISYIIYHCCILVGTNNAATRWWQSLRNSPLPFLLSPTPLAFVIHPRPQVCWFSFLLHQEIIRSLLADAHFLELAHRGGCQSWDLLQSMVEEKLFSNLWARSTIWPLKGRQHEKRQEVRTQLTIPWTMKNSWMTRTWNRLFFADGLKWCILSHCRYLASLMCCLLLAPHPFKLDNMDAAAVN